MQLLTVIKSKVVRAASYPMELGNTEANSEALGSDRLSDSRKFKMLVIGRISGVCDS